MALKPNKPDGERSQWSDPKTEYLARIDEKLGVIAAELQKMNRRENSRRWGGGPG